MDQVAKFSAPAPGPGQCFMIEFPAHADKRGRVTFIESQRHVPFAIERIFYLYDVPAGESRGTHAHKVLEQVMIAIAGSFEIKITDGRRQEKFVLDRPGAGLYIGPMLWQEVTNFSQGAVCLVLASKAYDEEEYFRDFKSFLLAVGSR
jgi:dTDP-4-dehydrorhamnose 3,5-epimerase-like enzyme